MPRAHSYYENYIIDIAIQRPDFLRSASYHIPIAFQFFCLANEYSIQDNN